jgi:hypothetical protein
MAAHELGVVLMEKVVPYFTKQVRANTLPPLTLLERQEAARLSLEPSDVLLCRQVGGEQWYFCRKRVLGVGRPTITEADVDRYFKERKSWDIEDVYHAANIRKFNCDECTCFSFTQWRICLHVRGARIRAGIVQPGESERPKEDSSGTTASHRIDRNIKRRISGTYCFACSNECGNQHNFDSHVDGKGHKRIAEKLWRLLKAARPKSTVPWGGCVIEKAQAKKLKRGDIVFVAHDDRHLAQGVVSGVIKHRQKATAHVATSQTTELTFGGNESVFRLVDEPVDHSPMHARGRQDPSTPPSSGRNTSRGATAKRSHEPRKPPPDTPPITRKRRASQRANAEMLEKLGLGPTKPRKRSRAKLKLPKKRSIRRPRRRNKRTYWLSSSDIQFLQMAMNIHDGLPKNPIPFDKFAEMLDEALRVYSPQDREWQCNAINTGQSGTRGIHWVIGFWRMHGPGAGTVHMWDPYKLLSLSKHIETELRNIPGLRVTLDGTGIQLPEDTVRCGRVVALWLQYGHALCKTMSGDFNTAMLSHPIDPPEEWDDIVFALLEAKDYQTIADRELGVNTRPEDINLAKLVRHGFDTNEPVFHQMLTQVEDYVTALKVGVQR